MDWMDVIAYSPSGHLEIWLVMIAMRCDSRSRRLCILVCWYAEGSSTCNRWHVNSQWKEHERSRGKCPETRNIQKHHQFAGSQITHVAAQCPGWTGGEVFELFKEPQIAKKSGCPKIMFEEIGKIDSGCCFSGMFLDEHKPGIACLEQGHHFFPGSQSWNKPIGPWWSMRSQIDWPRIMM